MLIAVNLHFIISDINQRHSLCRLLNDLCFFFQELSFQKGDILTITRYSNVSFKFNT